MIEKIFLRYKPRFVWIYFNWGKFYKEKRIVLEFYVQIGKHVRGFSIGWSNEEKEMWLRV